MNHIAENVRRIRESRNWTQEQLADMLSANVRTIQRLERGEQVSEETIRDVATVFKVDRAVLNLNAKLVQEEMERIAAAMKQTHREVSLRRIQHGHQLCGMMKAELYLHDCQSDDDAVRDLSAAFQAYIEDLDAAWSVMSAEGRRATEKEFDKQLAAFAALGYSLYAGEDERRVNLTNDPPDRAPMDWTMLVTCIVKTTKKPFLTVLVPKKMSGMR